MSVSIDVTTAAAMQTQCRRWVIFDRDAATSISRHVGYAPKAEVKSGYWQSVTTGRSGLMMPPGA